MVTALTPSAPNCSSVSKARQPACSVALARCSGKGSTIPTRVVFGSPPKTRAWLVPITPARIPLHPVTKPWAQRPGEAQRSDDSAPGPGPAGTGPSPFPGVARAAAQHGRGDDPDIAEEAAAVHVAAVGL